jgi:hypothetical protein
MFRQHFTGAIESTGKEKRHDLEHVRDFGGPAQWRREG